MSAIESYETRGGRVLRYLLIVVMTVVLFFPILWIFMSSITPSGEIFSTPPEYFPKEVTLAHYEEFLSQSVFLRYILNSVFIATSTTLVSLGLAVVSSYGWAWFDFPGARVSSIFVLVSQIFPIVVLIIPLFEILRQLSLLNSYPGLALSYMVFTLPLTTWMLKGFFESIPENVLQAARIDGLSEFRVFWEVALPLVKPGIGATAIYCFIVAWQEFFFALTFTRDESMQTLPVGLVSFIGQYEVSWGLLMAGSFVSVLPAAIVFMFLQKYFIRSLAGSGLKG